MQTVIVLRQPSHLRTIEKPEAFSILSDAERASAPEDFLVDMTPFASDVENGGWGASHAFVREQAEIFRQQVVAHKATAIHYLGLAEISHIIALGAYIGDELAINVHEYERNSGSWHWPNTEQTLHVTAQGTPLEEIPASGIVVIRIGITSAILDEDVRAALSEKPLSDIVIKPADEVVPQPGLVCSAADLEAVRLCFREQLAALLHYRPGTEVIHLFVSAPASVCFVIGQELRLRNTRPVQTYRYRSGQSPPHAEALRLELSSNALVSPLTTDEKAIADRIRTETWPQALQEVQAYARALQSRTGGKAKRWFEPLHWFDSQAKKRGVKPFPGLPFIWEAVGMEDGVDETPLSNLDYALDLRTRKWRLNDRLLVGLSQAVNDDEQLRRLIRLFLFHEYLHTHHVLSKVTADEVGKFENCLERLDYGADLFALLHEFDFAFDRGQAKLGTEREKRQFLATQIEQIIQSFWAFESSRPVLRWQVRRVRRHLNWYWRQVQVQYAPDLVTALLVLSKPPAIELAGLKHLLEGRRHFVVMDEKKIDAQTGLELGLVAENESFIRISNSPNTNLPELIAAFREGDHEGIKRFFDSTFSFVKQAHGAFPPEGN